MKTTDICNRLKVALKHSALALAATAGLAIGSAQALTTTTVINLGAFNSGGTAFGTDALVSKISQGALPAGSILRSVTMNYRLAAGDPYLGDLCLLCADSTGNNGVLMVKGNVTDEGYDVTASPTVLWNSGGDYTVGVTATQTLTAADGIPAIDLNASEVWLVTGAWAGTWEGSITLEYDVPPLGIRLDTPADGQGIPAATPIDATATLIQPTPATGPYAVKFFTKLLPAGSLVEWIPSNSGALYTAALGVLAEGDYEIYAEVTDSATPTPETATSLTRTFTVAPLEPTTIVLNAAGAATTYGDNVTFTATVSPPPNGGTVQFLADGNYIGDPVAVDTVTGEATVSTTTLGAGSLDITAEYSGYEIYEASTTAASITQVVGQAPLTVRALNTLRAPNTANPAPLPYQITGYQNGENLGSSGVTGTPLLTTTAILSSPAGDYPITCALGTLAADNYSFTLENGTLTVAELVDTFSVNFYAQANTSEEYTTNNQLVPANLPAGLGEFFTTGWTNVNAPFSLNAPLPPQALTSNIGSTANFIFKNMRNGWVYDGERTTLLGDGNGNMMDGHVNSTFDPGDGSEKFDMEMTDIPFAVYDVIFYLGANVGQFGDGTGVIVFNGGSERAFKLAPGRFNGTFTEMVDATTEGNYIVFRGVTGTSFTAQTWGTGDAGGIPGFVHLGPFGFQIREAAPVASGFTTWADANNATGQTPDQDHDNDGVDNGIEYFMGETGSTFTANPSLNASNAISWPASATYEGTYEVQTSPDLATWTNVDPRPLVVDDTLSYTLPTGLGKRFVRLLVTPTP